MQMLKSLVCWILTLFKRLKGICNGRQLEVLLLCDARREREDGAVWLACCLLRARAACS